MRPVAGETIIWRPMSEFPCDGRTVLLLDSCGVNFARYEPEAGQDLKIVSVLGAVRLGNRSHADAWAKLPTGGGI